MCLVPVVAADSSVGLLVIAIFVAIVLVYFGQQHEKKLASAWTEVALRYGLQQNGKFDLVGQVDGLEVAAEVYTTGSGKSRKTWTRVIITGQLTRAVKLAAEGFFSTVFGQDVLTGDGAFDGAVKVQGDESSALALLDGHTREIFQNAISSGWSFADGSWTLKASGRLGEELGARIEVGMSLAQLTRKRQSNPPERLAALVTHDSLVTVRRRALSCLLTRFAKSSSTTEALTAACLDSDPKLRLMASQHLGDLQVLNELAADERLEQPLRVEALESMVRVGPGDSRTRERVGASLALIGPHQRLLRKAAIEAVETVTVEGAEAILIDALSEDDDAIKLAAIRTLGALGTVDAVPALAPFRDKLLAFTLKGAAKDAILAIQSRIAGADAGALSLAADGGGLAIAAEEPGPTQEG